MLNLKIAKEKNEVIKIFFNILFILFITFNTIWHIKMMWRWDDPIGSLLYALIPLYLGILGSWKIFNKFKYKNGLKFVLGTIFSTIMYYVFWGLGVVILFLIAIII